MCSHDWHIMAIEGNTLYLFCWKCKQTYSYGLTQFVEKWILPHA